MTSAMELGDSQDVNFVSEDMPSAINRPADVFSLLAEHLPLESDDSSAEEETFSCSRCRLLYVDPEVGRLHELSEDCERHWPGHQCSICGLGFEDFQLRVQHETEDHDFQNLMTQTATCTICEADCGGLDAVTPHMREVHYQATSRTVCDAIYATDGVSGATFQASSSPSVVRSKGGQQAELSSSAKKRNISVSTQKEQVNKKAETNCSSCCKKFATNLSYLQHMYTKHDSPYCRPCGESFKCKDDLHQHTEQNHKCSLCGKHLAQNADLSKHMQVQHGRSKPEKADGTDSIKEAPQEDRAASQQPCTGWFRCPFCQAESRSAEAYFHHCVRFHIACPLCLRAFPDDLEQQVDGTPTEPAPPGSTNTPAAVSQAMQRVIQWTAQQTREKGSENFMCRSCGCSFPEKTAFLQHKKAKHGASVCFLCEETFSDKRGMLQHFNMKHNVPVCLECELKFTNSTSFQQHMAKEHNVHSSETTLASSLSSGVQENLPDISSKASHSSGKHVPVHYCSKCDRTFTNKQALEQHNKGKHAPEHFCSKCDRTFSNAQALEQHNKGKHAPEHYCSKCNKGFVNEQALEQHKGEHASAHCCSKCNRGFVNEQALNQHYRDKHREALEQHNKGKHAPEHYCFKCNKGFVNEQALEQHKGKHGPAHYCSKCNRGFVNEQALEQHKGEHAPAHYCSKCNRGFVNEQALDQHYRDKHREALEQHNKGKHAPENYCSTCNRGFVNEHALEQHNKAKHAPQHYCSTCDIEFVNENALEEHNWDKHNECYSTTDESATESERTESSEYACYLCDKDFVDELTLEQHYLDQHGFEHYCDTCDRVFVSEQALEQHNRDKPDACYSPTTTYESGTESESSGDFTYFCDLCDIDFVDERALEQHERDKHGY